MNIAKLNLNEVARMVHQNAIQHGFHPEDQSLDLFLANQCCNIHAEVSEFWDAHRAGKSLEHCDKADKMVELGFPPLTCQEEELADIVIRALDVSRRLGIDIMRAIGAKHAYNVTRPFRHGKMN